MRLKKQKPLGRAAGVLLPVASLPSPYGIGTFGKAAYDFVDFLEAAGQRYWQVLPLGPTSYGDSPYQSFSAFAGNPYLIDLDMLTREGLLKTGEAAAYDWGDDPCKIDYARLYASRFEALGRAFARSGHRDAPEFKSFCEENAFWLDDYALFMALKFSFDGAEWLKWPEKLRMREPKAVAAQEKKLKKEADFWRFCQYQFFRQWGALKAYANERDVRIIGDLPIYVALDSADVWVHGAQFQLDEKRRPVRVAGVPPDCFSTTGQLWGNPIYDWEKMERDGFSWWKKRMAASARLYDLVRIDHFIGIVRYYSIPAADKTAENGVWVDGPGEKLLAALGEAPGGARIIAEDLGVVTPQVRRLLRRSGYPGMKVLEFAFDSGAQNSNLPCHYTQNCAVYGGTHDNETLVGFFAHQPRAVSRFAREYLGVRTNKELPWAAVRAGYASVADTAIYQLQDLLGLDNTARVNTPSTLGGNWEWRMEGGELTPELARRLRGLARTYARA